MMTHVPEIGGVIAFTQYQKRRKTNCLSIDELIQNKMSILTLVIPCGNDGSVSHNVVVMDDIIFSNATQSNAMKLCRESLDWIYGKCSIGGIKMAVYFERPVKMKKKYARSTEKAW
jgi:hypothetical protein